MATTCPTTEAALQTGLLPAQERRKGCFAKASAFLIIVEWTNVYLIPIQKISLPNKSRSITPSDLRAGLIDGKNPRPSETFQTAFRVCSPFITRQSFGSKKKPAALKILARCSTLLRFPPCKHAFVLKILRADELWTDPRASYWEDSGSITSTNQHNIA